VKVDRSFVQGIVDSERDRAVLRSIVQVADALGLWFLAEGVETEAERAILIDLGAHLAQGYRFARPMPAAAFTEFLATAQPDR